MWIGNGTRGHRRGQIPPGAAAAAWAWFYQELNNGKIKILEQITVLI